MSKIKMKSALRILLFIVVVSCSLSNSATFGQQPGLDQHFVPDDVYFIPERPLGNERYQWADPARMIAPASAATKGEAQFVLTSGGKLVFTKYFLKTRVAGPQDLRVGTEVIGFNRTGDNSIYRAPKSKEEALGNTRWFLTRIVDVSDIAKGYVIVSGGDKVANTALRVKGTVVSSNAGTAGTTGNCEGVRQEIAQLRARVAELQRANPSCSPANSRGTETGKFGAIAYSRSTGRFGNSSDQPSIESAETIALQQCRPRDCQVQVWFRNSCAALAKGSNGQTAFFVDPAKEIAERIAVKACKKRGGECTVVCSVCSLQ